MVTVLTQEENSKFIIYYGTGVFLVTLESLRYFKSFLRVEKISGT